MTSQNKVNSKIFWPRKCTDSPSGYLVGWNVRGFTGCVATVVSDCELPELKEILKKISVHPKVKDLPSGPPVVLGCWIREDIVENHFLEQKGAYKKEKTSVWFQDDENMDKKSTQELKSKLNKDLKIDEALWMIVVREKQSENPILRELYCYDYKFMTMNQIIFYEFSNKRQFFTADPLQLDPEFYEVPKKLPDILSSPLVQGTPKNPNTESEMEESLRQINCALEMESILLDEIKSHKSNPKKSDLETPELTPPKNGYHPNNPKRPDYVFFWLVSSVIFAMSSVGEKILKFLDTQIQIGSWQGDIASLSYAGTYFQHKLAILLRKFPVQQEFFHSSFQNTPKSRANYLSFGNRCSVIFVDSLAGILVAALLYNYWNSITSFCRSSHIFLNYNMLQQVIMWLMGWPAGFKLNDNLDNFFGQVFLFYIDKWMSVVDQCSPYLHWLLWVVILSSLGGFTVLIAVILDIYCFFTFHVYCFYSASARIYNLQLQMMYSLWLLFRGKKYNPLKKRIDSCEYNIDQLLLGTFLFTVNIFLLPTTAIYYLCFLQIQMVVLLFKNILAFVSETLYTFPFFTLILYCFQKDFFPGGVWLEILSVNTQTAIRKNVNTTCFYLRTKTLPISACFYEMKNKLARQASEISVKTVVVSLLTGRQ